jgi:secreted PhoX family phosphatase
MRDTDDIGSNKSNNPHIADMIAARISRRGFVAGSVQVAATGFFGGSLLADAAPAKGSASWQLGFIEVPPSAADAIAVPPGYTWHVLAPWGEPLLPGAPQFAEDASGRRPGVAGRL